MEANETIKQNKRSFVLVCSLVAVIVVGAAVGILLVETKHGKSSTANATDASAGGSQQANAAASSGVSSPDPSTSSPQQTSAPMQPADIVLGMNNLLLTNGVAEAPPADPNSIYGTDMLQDQHAMNPNGQWAEAPVNGPERFAEWTFASPGGTYQIIGTYAAAETRPLTLSVDGTVVFASAFSTLTGGWNPQNRQSLALGSVTLSPGTKLLRISCPANQAFPHVKEIKLTLITTS